MKSKNFIDDLLNLELADLFKVKEYEWISSGHCGLNYCLSGDMYKGYPLGSVVEVFGAEGLGKSSLGYKALAEIQKIGGYAFLIDIEASFNQAQIKRSNIPYPDKIITCKKKDLISVIKFIITILKQSKEKGFKGVILWDSYASTPLEGGSGGMAEESRIMSIAMKQILSIINDTNICLFVINQLRENFASPFGGTTAPGGRALKHASQIRINLNKTTGKEKINMFNDDYGNGVIVKVMKNKFYNPSTCQISVGYQYGIDWEMSLLTELYIHNKIKISAGWWEWNGKKYRKYDLWKLFKQNKDEKELAEKILKEEVYILA